MKRLTLVLLPVLLSSAALAAPSTTGGSSGLALAALVAAQSPLVSAPRKTAMARMLNGNLAFSWPAGHTISVTADSVVCRASNVDISAHSCVLKFGTHTRNLAGRKAHELFATIGENGVPGDGAAGSIFEGLGSLACTIDPNAVKQRDGSGATCSFTPGAP